MKAGRLVGLAACVLLLMGTGCKKEGAGTGSGSGPVFTTIDWSTAGAIEGTVHYSKTPPKPVEIDMNQDPACTLGPTLYSEQYVVSNGGGFANVFIYVKDGLGNKVYAAPATPVGIDQKGCRYIPHVVGVMVGQPVQFTNSDPTMHNVHMVPTVAGNQAVDISQSPAGGANGGHAQDERTFAKPELMMPVRCNNHPWMQAFINVSANPFYAVTDVSGRYMIKGLPPGTYTVVADQEQAGQQTATVTVPAKGTATQDFTY
ncbi:MAG: carboxypeptidase regulatory-like domain-containing protein [Acidobacteriaceae bacterium]